MTITLNQIFFPSTKIRTFCSATIGIRIFFFRKKTIPPPWKLNGPSLNGVCVTRSLVLYVCFVNRCLSFCTFSFDHCVVCSSIYGFWLPLWYLQTLLAYTVHDLPLTLSQRLLNYFAFQSFDYNVPDEGYSTKVLCTLSNRYLSFY